jgi:hypothetical protein
MYVPNDPLRALTNEELKSWFGFHPAASQELRDMHQQSRLMFAGLALELNAVLPEGREKVQCLEALRMASMFSNAAIAMKSPMEDA